MAANHLLTAFQAAYQLFNTQQWATLEPLLHDDVTMKRIDDPVDYHHGKAAVMGYFFTNGKKDRATFTPTSQACLIVGSIGLVWGAADWTGTQGAAVVPIAYAYAFKNVKGNWLALNLWGAYAA